MPERSQEPLYAKTIAELRELSDDELVAQHDQLVGVGGYTAAPKYYLEELARRREDRAANRMITLTWVIAAMTAVNVAGVILAVFAK